MGEKVEHSRVKTTEVSFEILEELKDSGPAKVTELATTLERPKSTVYNHVWTLEQNEYLVRINGRYHIGCRFLDYGAKARQRHAIFDVGRSEIDRLANETGEITGILIEEHGLGVFLHQALGQDAVGIDTYTGDRIYLHSAALGKVILANLPAERRTEIIDQRGLPSITQQTITDETQLREELASIREQGVAYDYEERLPNLRAVAAPVLDDASTVLGAISVAGPTHRLNEERLQGPLTKAVKSAAEVIELNAAHS